MKKIIISVLVILFTLELSADIAPYPVQAKGITINEPTEIKMVYEKVTVDLTIDSSYVHCYFRLHNEGKATKIQIGYPNMGYYSNSDHNYKSNPILVYENGKKIKNINSYAPDPIKLVKNDNKSKPWYLWDTFFDENETRIIEVSYSLPYGMVKNNLCRRFDYLLSTGAGWKGKIDTAEIIINLKNIDKNLILKTSPTNYIASGNQVIWNLFDIEPTKTDDISVFYETAKGSYEEMLRQKTYPLFVLDNSIILSNNIRDDNSLGNIIPTDIGFIQVIQESKEAKKQYPNLDCSNGLYLIFSKKFAVDKLNRIIRSKFPTQDTLIFSSVDDFEKNHIIKINNQQTEDWYGDIILADDKKFVSISIKKISPDKEEINIGFKH